MKFNKSYGAAAILTAIAASICCIAPVLALIAGAGGLTSSFSWVEPFRPYMIIATVLFLGIAWYQALKPKKELDCDCPPEHKSSFMNSRVFLAIITIFSAFMLSFPLFSSIFTQKSEITFDASNANTELVLFEVEGMTCAACEGHIVEAVTQLDGVESVQVSYEEGTAMAAYDKSKLSESDLIIAINSTGYSVIE